MSQGGPYKTGQRFGPYVLEQYLGAGAFKSVYRARCTSADTEHATVALGFPHQQDEDGIAELQKEFAALVLMIHPNILRVHQLEHHEGITFIVMEFVEGDSLRKVLRTETSLPSDLALRYVGMLCEALSFAHSARVLHRDVKPENVLITTAGIPKLVDFGVARILTTSRKQASTNVGTVEYMAPEQMQGAAGPNADLWALGVLFFELLVGQRPFTGDVGEIYHKIMTGKYDERPLFQKGIDIRLIRILRKMLRKDPETRYQTADELLTDLEAVARRTRLVDDDESRLEVLIRASVPLVYVVSSEEDRVLSAIRDVSHRLGEERRRSRPVLVWSASRGLRDQSNQLLGDDTLEDPTAALLHIIQNPDDAVYVFLDLHRHFSPVVTRLIRDVARTVRATRKSLVMISPAFQVPDELQKEVTLAVFQLPDRVHLEPVLRQVEDAVQSSGRPVTLSDSDRENILRAAAGLTLNEAELAFRYVAENRGGFGPDASRDIAQLKTQVIRKSGLLDYYHQSESFANVGGLEQLLHWFQQRAPAFANTVRYAGLPMPKGVLLVGVPGCGKSLSARALAGAWGVPLLRLDVGRLFGSLVGASEGNLRMAIQTAEAVSPCILWIDEVEKGFSGNQSHSGGGVAVRIFGNFLSWLQDKRSPVFVVATANDLSSLPPEFLRAGRFDEIFFVGVPKAAERETIWNIHLARRNRNPAQFNSAVLAQVTEGFSGAEIEQAVVTGLFRAFAADRALIDDDLLAAVRETVPLSRSRAPEISALTNWARQNARMASG